MYYILGFITLICLCLARNQYLVQIIDIINKYNNINVLWLRCVVNVALSLAICALIIVFWSYMLLIYVAYQISLFFYYIIYSDKPITKLQ